MNDYETRRLEKIKRNQALLHELGINRAAANDNLSKKSSTRPPPQKRRKLDTKTPTRTSSRIASNPSRPTYNEDESTRVRTAETRRPLQKPQKQKSRLGGPTKPETTPVPQTSSSHVPTADVESLREGWSSWTPLAPLPTRDGKSKRFHFDSHPSFTPNKSPAEVLREGCFGGSYFRPLYSRKLGITVEGDWYEIPTEWIEGLNVDKYLTSPTYDPDVNKFKVASGQSIEQWEEAGWIDHRHDVRGWFQWYCRFFQGRRCDDDDRQVDRWKRCVGPTGRWRRLLLKRYVALGVREVFDDGEDGEDAPEVSPVQHQTCHHWAFEVRQDDLDRYWTTGQ